MAVTQYTWDLIEDPGIPIPTEVDVSLFDRTVSIGAEAHLGFGLLRPFRRDEKNDFANAGGAALVRSAVGQILGTRSAADYTQGELKWNTEFGSLLYFLRHINNDVALQELAKLRVVEALKRWEPRLLVKAVDISKESTADGDDNVLVIRLVYDLIDTNVPGNNVILPDIEQRVVVSS